MITKRQQDALELYGKLMEEVKIRIEAVSIAASGRIGFALPSQTVKEFCYLQLRMLCELIALGCLVAHGDIRGTESNALKKEWAADKILKQLESLHPFYYPLPARQDPADWNHLILQERGFLTKDELPKLYGECGDKLHKGSLRKLLSSKAPIQKTFPDIIATAQKIYDLLGVHAISLFDGKVMVCILKNSDDSERVQVVLTEKRPGE